MFWQQPSKPSLPSWLFWSTIRAYVFFKVESCFFPKPYQKIFYRKKCISSHAFPKLILIDWSSPGTELLPACPPWQTTEAFKTSVGGIKVSWRKSWWKIGKQEFLFVLQVYSGILTQVCIPVHTPKCQNKLFQGKQAGYQGWLCLTFWLFTNFPSKAIFIMSSILMAG
jgi:hypothetical protein